MTSHGERILDAALRYLSLGLSVLPLHGVTDDGRCTCGKASTSFGCNVAKHPVGLLVASGAYDASSDEAVIRSWFGRRHRMNIGVATGALVVFDIDNTNVASDLIKAVNSGEIAHVAVAQSGGANSGAHAYYLNAEGTTKTVDILLNGKKVGDLKGAGGYAVSPPSQGINRRYKWLTSSPIQAVDDPKRSFTKLFRRLGYEVSFRTDPTFIAVSDAPVAAISLPFESDWRGDLQLWTAGLVAPERPGLGASAILMTLGNDVVRAANHEGYPITEDQVAGVVKQVDGAFYKKYSWRGHDVEYRRIAKKALLRYTTVEAAS